MGTHPIFESDFDCLTDCWLIEEGESDMKVIPTERRELLTNFEVLEAVNRYQNEQKEKAKKRKHSVKADEALNTVTLETANYLSKLPAAQQSKEGIVEFVQKLKADDDGAKLLPNELMQIVNLRPQQPVELYLLIEDIEGRISEENVDKLQGL